MPASDIVGSGLRQYHEDSVASFLWRDSGSFSASLVPGCHVAPQETDCRRTVLLSAGTHRGKKIFPPEVLTDLVCVTWSGLGRGVRLTGESGTQEAWAGNNTGALV